MSLKTITREVSISITAKVLEQEGNYKQSRQWGQLLTLEELPQFLGTRVRDLENTESYKQKGQVWFYFGTVGTKFNGYYEINLSGKTVEEMFIPIKDSQQKTLEEGGNESQIRNAWLKLDFDKRARFFGGDKPLSVVLYRDPVYDDGRLFVVGNVSPRGVAPVVVVKQTQTNNGAATPEIASLVADAKLSVAQLERLQEDGKLKPGLVQPLKDLIRELE